MANQETISSIYGAPPPWAQRRADAPSGAKGKFLTPHKEAWFICRRILYAHNIAGVLARTQSRDTSERLEQRHISRTLFGYGVVNDGTFHSF